MLDRLPFPHITATRPEEQLSQVKDYLIQFKEALEFELMSISEDNLSREFADKLNALGADIDKNSENTNDQLAQMTSHAVTVSDVINSPSFDLALERKMPTFTINFSNGNLEYE